MINPVKSLVPRLVLMLSASLASCGGGSSPSGARPAVAGAGGQANGSAGTAGTGAAGAPDCPTSCDDGFSCTIDTCVIGECRHSIGPRTGEIACPAGQYCTLDSGCVAAPACATVDQCVAAWKDDACKTNIKCEAASSVCTFDLLDKDADGHSPQICGGDDCDDSKDTVHPGAAETCNAVDDNCNGVVDEDHANIPINSPGITPTDAICGTDRMTCANGQCVCKPENLCGTTCTDVSSDASNCGACGHSCGTSYGSVSHNGVGYWSCVAGTCQCSTVACGSVCTDLSSDNQNCGACGVVCADLDPNSWCLNGQCGRHCAWNTSISCSSTQVCKYTSAYGSECIPDPCPGQVLSCDAPCNASNNCAGCNAYTSHNLHCQ